MSRARDGDEWPYAPGRAGEPGGAGPTGRGEFDWRYGTGLAPAEVGRARAWIEVDLGAIGANVATIRRAVQPRLFMAVVKANAYGHGMVPAAHAALRAGADWLGVAVPEEAFALRAAGLTCPLLVMGYVPPELAPRIVAEGVTSAVYTAETARALSTAASSAGLRARVHVKVDVGLCRVGVAPEEAVAFATSLRRLAGLEVEGAFTHFSSADEGDTERTVEEFQLFQGALARLDAAGHEFEIRHAAASAALLDSPQTWLDMVRIGTAMYGYYPHPGCQRSLELRPGLSFKARIARLRRVPAGTKVGYGLTYTCPRETTIATIALGYADGLDKRLGNKGQVLVRGRRVPRVGSIAMDLSMIDVGAVPRVEVGDEVVIIGRQGEEEVTLDELSAVAGVPVEHTLALLSARPSRVYTEGPGQAERTHSSADRA